MEDVETNSSESTETSLSEIAWLFLRLGTTAFGGPAAHIAMMEEEIVRKRKWVTPEKFLDLLGASNLIPGPNSTELAIHIGYERGGWPGLIVAGVCFIVPAVALVLVIAWAYVEYGRLPVAESMLYAVKPVVVAVVMVALWQLGTTALKNKLLAVTGAVTLVLCFVGFNEIFLLFAAGVFIAIAGRLSRRGLKPTAASFVLPALFIQNTAAATVPVTTAGIFLTFLKIGSVLFGSGYVLLAFLRADLVERFGWITNQQLIDAVAVGQITPGPVFTTATFIGYVVYGIPGAIAATVGIFLPAFFFVAVSAWLIPRLRRSLTMGAFLNGVNVASLALMAYVTIEIARTSFVDPLSIIIFATSLVLIAWVKINSGWIITAAVFLGLLIS